MVSDTKGGQLNLRVSVSASSREFKIEMELLTFFSAKFRQFYMKFKIKRSVLEMSPYCEVLTGRQITIVRALT